MFLYFLGFATFAVNGFRLVQQPRILVQYSQCITITINPSLYKRYRVKIDEDILEEFIRKNKDELSDCQPSDRHLENFLYKFNLRIRHFISIVPYLIKVVVVTIIIFSASIIVWNNYLRKDRNQITLKDKITLTINRLKS